MRPARKTQPWYASVSWPSPMPRSSGCECSVRLDLALLASAAPFRPPDAETPPLSLQTLTERSLRIAVPATHPLARGEFADVADLHGQRWIAGSGEDRVMGVWPSLDERPDIAHTPRDWLAQRPLAAAGCGITTVTRHTAPRGAPARAT